MKHTFKSFLSEATRTNQISADGAIALIEKHCAGYLHQDRILWRGNQRAVEGCLYGDSRKGEERNSISTSNTYNIWIDGLPAFKDWPKRRRSFICSTSKKVAQGYSSQELPMIAIPYDGQPLAGVGRADIWAVSPKGAGIKLLGINDETAALIKPEGPVKSFDDLAKAMKAVKYEDVDNPRFLGIEEGETLYDFWLRCINPATFSGPYVTPDFTHFDFNEEVWFEGQAVFIQPDPHLDPKIIEWAKEYPHLHHALTAGHKGSPA
jgi:hypothetical protein